MTSVLELCTQVFYETILSYICVHISYIPDWKNVVGKKVQTLSDTTQ